MGATSDWKIPAADFPAGASRRDKLGFATKYAMLAPSVFGWPAWDYHIKDDLAELLARDGPRTSAMDHEEREIMIGCGTSLQLFKLALKHVGCLGRVELFPNLDRPELVAIIHAGRGSERDALQGRLFAAIRYAGVPAPVRDDSLDLNATITSLEHAVERERSWLEFARNETSRARLRTLALPPRRFEIEEVHIRKDDWPDERPPRRAGARSLFDRFSRWRKPQLIVKVRAPSSLDSQPDESIGISESAGAFAVLKTRTDDKHGWVAAGLTLARLILQAQVLGISCAMHHQPLRAAYLRAALRTEIGRKGFIQAILQFGLQPAAGDPAPFKETGLRSNLASSSGARPDM